MSTILTETEGFTPVIDVLAQELSVMTAIVYGVVWRYCQMKNKVCSASRETIANHAGISTKTVDRHLDKLCKAGYLKDLHPDWKHRPHIYVDTGKLKIEGLLKVKRGETESPTSELGETESPGGETESPTRSDGESNQGETESPTRIPSYDSIHESKEGEFPEKTKTADPLSFDLERQTLNNKEGNYADPADDALVDMAITCLCEGNTPKKGSGTWRDMAETIKPIHADWGLHDEEISKALAIIRAAIALFLEEKQQMAVYRYPSFAANYGQYLSRAMNGDMGAPARRARDDADAVYERATRMTLERLRNGKQ